MALRVFRVVQGANANAESKYAGALSVNCEDDAYQRIVELAKVRGGSTTHLVMQILWYGFMANEFRADPEYRIEIVRGGKAQTFDYGKTPVKRKVLPKILNYVFSDKGEESKGSCNMTFKVSQAIMDELDWVAAAESLSGIDEALWYMLHCGLSLIELIHDPDCDVVLVEDGRRKMIVF